MEDEAPPEVYLCDHPLVANLLASLRYKDCPHSQYRYVIGQLYQFLAYEALRTMDVPTETIAIETPVGSVAADQTLLLSERMVLVAIMRSGLAPAGAVHALLPQAPLAHVGVGYDPGEEAPRVYYSRFPKRFEDGVSLVIEPTVSSGQTVLLALAEMERHGLSSDRATIVSVVCTPEGVAAVKAAYPGVTIVAAALDEGVNERGYVLPGIGDAGDRIYETEGADE